MMQCDASFQSDMTMEEVREYERTTQEATNLKIGTFPPTISISETPLASCTRSGPNSAPSTPLSTEAPDFLSVPKERPRKKSAPETLTLPDPGRRDSLFKLPSFFSWNSSPQPEWGQVCSTSKHIRLANQSPSSTTCPRPAWVKEVFYCPGHPWTSAGVTAKPALLRLPEQAQAGSSIPTAKPSKVLWSTQESKQRQLQLRRNTLHCVSVSMESNKVAYIPASVSTYRASNTQAQGVLLKYKVQSLKLCTEFRFLLLHLWTSELLDLSLGACVCINVMAICIGLCNKYYGFTSQVNRD